MTDPSENKTGRWAAGALVLAVFAWSYGPTWLELWQIWGREADYSHGVLVAPLAVFFLWLRRDLLTDRRLCPNIWGLLLLALSVLMRYVGARYSFDSFDGYSLVVWVAGSTLLLTGTRVFLWALPSIAFLLFMVPLPFQVERLLSVPLQRVATAVSSFLLQCLGQPAFAEGTTILLGSQQLEVEHACSGLRIFMGTFALACAYVIATRRELWEKTILLVAVIPIALIANAIRIVTTGLLYRYAADTDLARQFNHDMAGWLMIFLAAGLFGLLLWYLSRLLRQVDVVTVRELVARGQAET